MIHITTARLGLHWVAVYVPADYIHDVTVYVEWGWTERGATKKLLKTLDKRGVS